MKDITPERFRCGPTISSCPAIYEDAGDYVIIGLSEGVARAGGKCGPMESAVSVPRELIEEAINDRLRTSGGKPVGDYVGCAGVVRLLREACDKEGGQIDFARKHDLSPAYVSDVVRERRDPGQGILAALGLVKVTLYARAEGEDDG